MDILWTNHVSYTVFFLHICLVIGTFGLSSYMGLISKPNWSSTSTKVLGADALRMRLRRLCTQKYSGKCWVDEQTVNEYREGGEKREWLELALLECPQRHGVDTKNYKKIRVRSYQTGLCSSMVPPCIFLKGNLKPCSEYGFGFYSSSSPARLNSRQGSWGFGNEWVPKSKR